MHKAVIIGLIGLAASYSFPASAVTDKQRETCKEATTKLADVIVDTKGKGRFGEFRDAGTSKIGEQVWNSMLLAYNNNRNISRRELATVGYTSCLAKM